MARHLERQAELKLLLARVLHDYRQAYEAGYRQGRSGEGAGGRSSDPSDPTGNMAADEPGSRAADLKANTGRSMRSADRHIEDAILSAQKALKALSRPFVKPGDWTSIKDAGPQRTATTSEVKESMALARRRMQRGEE